MIEIKLIIVAIGAILFFIGGLCWLPARRFILPTILALSSLWISHSWYALTMLSCIGVFCLGYGEKSPDRHIFGNFWGRCVWGVLSAICLSLALFLTGHLAWYFFVPYLIVNFLLEGSLKDFPQVVGDPIIGSGFASIVLLIH